MCEHGRARSCCRETSKQLLKKQCFINRGKYLQMTQPFSLLQALKKKLITSFVVTTSSWELHCCTWAHFQAFLSSPNGQGPPQPPSRHPEPKGSSKITASKDILNIRRMPGVSAPARL